MQCLGQLQKTPCEALVNFIIEFVLSEHAITYSSTCMKLYVHMVLLFDYLVCMKQLRTTLHSCMVNDICMAYWFFTEIAHTQTIFKSYGLTHISGPPHVHTGSMCGI